MDDADTRRSWEIVLVDDDREDVERTRRALARLGGMFRLTVLATIREGIALLRERSAAETPALPAAILVNLHMSQGDGPQLLAEARCNDRWRSLPVIVLASPWKEEDVLEAFDLEAWHCVRKTAEIDVFALRLGAALEHCLGRPPVPIAVGDPVLGHEVAEAILLKLKRGDAAPSDRKATGGLNWRRTHRRLATWWKKSA